MDLHRPKALFNLNFIFNHPHRAPHAAPLTMVELTRLKQCSFPAIPAPARDVFARSESAAGTDGPKAPQLPSAAR